MSLFLAYGNTFTGHETTFLDEILYPQKVIWDSETYSKTKTGFVYVPHLLVSKVLPADKKFSVFRENPSLGKTAFILASGSSNFAGASPRNNQNHTRLYYNYKPLPLTLTNVYAGRIANQICSPDYVATDATACVSSLKVLMDCLMLEQYGYTRFYIVTTEDQVSNTTLEFFGEARASLTKEREDKEGVVPSAFDSKNGGFYVGQGAAFAVLTTEKEAEYLGITPKARLVSAYHCSEKANNAIGQREDGKGFFDAIDGALTYGQVNPNEITIVKTHGTGTTSNNVSEKAGLRTALKDFVATSYKPKIGHTMGASGLLETILLLDNITNGVVPKIDNRTEDDDVFLSKDCVAPKGLVLSLAAGMGNVYSAAIFEPMR